MNTPLYSDVVTKMQKRAADNAARDFAVEVELLNGSPIETVFVATMLGHGWRPGYSIWTNGADARVPLEDHGLELTGTTPRPRIYGDGHAAMLTTIAVAEAQLHLPSGRLIRPDFAFVWVGDEHVDRVIVELDGHDWHERSPEQAEADKSRDRELQSIGWKVLRFTGREVLRKPRECLYEAEKLVSLLAYQARGSAYPELKVDR